MLKAEFIKFKFLKCSLWIPAFSPGIYLLYEAITLVFGEKKENLDGNTLVEYLVLPSLSGCAKSLILITVISVS